MEILAVIIGYLLGVAPHVIPKIIEMIQNRTKKNEEVKENKEQQEIIDEWINGPKEEIKSNINQQDLFNEYVTGEITTKGE